MAHVITIDRAGRVVIPKPVRDALRLHRDARLRVSEQAGRIVLEPLEEEPELIRRDGLILFGGELVATVPDARRVREERLAELERRVTRRRP